ncbi:endonuclease/exonuclease/phosphatase family protein [Actinacidiphila alni]|uniref:endonuclease/exonuclease/phosphatase family protein n=1 Tax=Actinacidiphila alni TaxID=380248 RepID=UPI0034551918
MRFVTFNVLHGQVMAGGRPVAGAVGGPGESGELGEVVGGLGADVVALQEVDRGQERSGRVDQARAAAEAGGFGEWRYGAAVHGRSVPGEGWALDPGAPELGVYGPGDAGGPPAHGVVLMSRLPVRRWRARRLPPAPVGLPLRVAGRRGLVPVRDQPRAALAAVLAGGQGPFTVVALHLSFVPGWNVRQLRAVRRWIDDLPRPHLLLGDFNLIGAAPRAVLNGPRGAGPWRDLARTATYPAHRPRVQFDHVLAAGLPAATVRAAVRGAHAPAVPVSDHRPLVVDLDV